MPRWNYKNFQERFWCKVDKNGTIPKGLNTPCWDWTGGKQTDGYGSLGMNVNGKWSCWPAHRVSWLIHCGNLPVYPENEICHICDNRSCVNPEHLFVASHAENIKDMFKKGRNNNAKGENQARAKLTENEVLEIRRLHASIDITFADLGKMFGISDTHAGYIVKRQSWKHI